MLTSKVKSWFTGYNVNVDRNDTPRLLIYAGGNVRYRKHLTEQAEQGYPGFVLRRATRAEASPVSSSA